jgi:organic radical activating enzyme
MFGSNEVTSPFPKADGSLLVNSIWPTIQGEGPDAGTPAIFVRLSKCNLRCHFCDTEFETGTHYEIVPLLEAICAMAGRTYKLVVLTGGEPLLQNITPLVVGCNTAGLRVSVETAGLAWQDGLDYIFKPDGSYHGNRIICSPKTPKLNKDLIPQVFAWKYIISPGSESLVDGLPIVSTQVKDKLAYIYRPAPDSKVPIYVQPMDEGDPTINEANQKFTARIAMEFGYLLSLQTHKIVGLP